MATEHKPYALGPEGWEGPGLPQSARASFMASKPQSMCSQSTDRLLGVPWSTH
jgi:hypothetical protein